MKIVILGVGKVGSTLTESFCAEGHEVCVIDRSEEKVAEIVNKFDSDGVVGNGLSSELLKEAGVADADYFIASTSGDESNILCCMLAKRLGAKHTVARVRDPQYFDEIDSLRDYLGLDVAFNPERRAALDIVKILKFPSARSVENFANGKALLVKFDIKSKNPLIGKSLMEINRDYKGKILFGVVERKEKAFIPRGDFVIAEDDSVYIIAPEADITAFTKTLKIFKPKAKSVYIIGGSKIAVYLAAELHKSGVEITLIERDKAKCDEYSQILPYVTVIHGDGSDREMLKEEGLFGADACVTLTGLDEENIIISLYAIQQNNIKTVTKVDRSSITDMIKTLGLDSIISPRTSIANYIIGYVRARQGEDSEGLCSLYKLVDKVEAVEFNVKNNFNGLDVPLKKLKIKKDTLIAGIIRNDKFIIPNGDAMFKNGDKVIVVTQESKIVELNDILR